MGYFGSFLTSITFVPQVYKAWQTKSVGDLSRWMIVIVLTSAGVWLVYGIAIRSGPVIVANSVVLIFAFVLLYFTFRFKSWIKVCRCWRGSFILTLYNLNYGLLAISVSEVSVVWAFIAPVIIINTNKTGNLLFISFFFKPQFACFQLERVTLSGKGSNEKRKNGSLIIEKETDIGEWHLPF